jgi:hypothetical protein
VVVISAIFAAIILLLAVTSKLTLETGLEIGALWALVLLLHYGVSRLLKEPLT